MKHEFTEAIGQAQSVDEIIALIAALSFTETPHGRASFVVTSKGQEIKTAFKLVDAEALVISNRLDGTINPDFPELLQPRDRTRVSSLMQVHKIASDLRPAQLADSGMSSHGAPIVGADNVVESGNGRSMGIWRAYQQGQASHYRQYLIDNAEMFGLDPADVEKMTMPVLVRERLTETDRAQFAKDSNISDLQEMSASEKAYADAQFLTENVIALFNPSDDGNLLARSNDRFIAAFMREIGDTTTAGLLTADGRPTKQLVDRIQNALFAKAYKDERLVKMVSEEPDPDMRNILTALNTAAADFASMQVLSAEVHRDTVHSLVDGIEEVKSLDKAVTEALQDAISLVRQAKDSGQALKEVISQKGIFENSSPEAEMLALFIAENNRSAKRMGHAFREMARQINQEIIHQKQAVGDMFGGSLPDLRSLLENVSERLADGGSAGASGGFDFAMLESAGDGDGKGWLALVDRASTADELIAAVQLLVVPPPAESLFNRFLNTPISLRDADTKENTIVRPEDIQAWQEKYGYTKADIGRFLTSGELNGSYRYSLYQAILKGREAPDVLSPEAAPAALTRLARLTAPDSDFFSSMSYEKTLNGNLDALAEIPAVMVDFPAVSLSILDMFASRGIIPPSARQRLTDEFKTALKASPPQTADELKARVTEWREAIKKEAEDITEVTQRGRDILARAGFDKSMLTEQVNKVARRKLDAMKRIETLFAESSSNKELSSYLKTYSGRVSEFALAIEGKSKYSVPALSRAYFQGGQIIRSLSVQIRLFYEDFAGKPEAEELKSQLSILQDNMPFDSDTVDAVFDTIHRAADSLTAQSPVTDEQAQAWADEIEGVSEYAVGSKSVSYSPVAVLKHVYRLTGGNIRTLGKVQHKAVRASASERERSITLNARSDRSAVLYHEAGHHIEYSSPYLLERAKAFLRSKVTGRGGFVNIGTGRNAEYSLQSSLSEPYMARVYPGYTTNPKTLKTRSDRPSVNGTMVTEIYSMAAQLLADKSTAIRSLANDDGLIEFFLGVMEELQNV